MQCRVGAVFDTCLQRQTLGEQKFSRRSAMQGGSCFWYQRAMPNAWQTGIFPAECNAGWDLWTAVIEGACLLLALLLFPQVQVDVSERCFSPIFFRSSTFAGFKGIDEEYRAGGWLFDAALSLIATLCHGWEGSWLVLIHTWSGWYVNTDCPVLGSSSDPQPMLNLWICWNRTGFPSLSFFWRQYLWSKCVFQLLKSPCFIFVTLKGFLRLAPSITLAQSSCSRTVLLFFLFSIRMKSPSFSRYECPRTMNLSSIDSNTPRWKRSI